MGYKNVNKALSDHVKEDDLTKRYPIVDNLGRRQKVILINKSGLCALILSSKLYAEPVEAKSNRAEPKSKSLEKKSKSLENDSSRLLDYVSTELKIFSSELK
ncbi:MAG: hypothetical protein IKN22_02360 [Bacteroidaceae bacterium]|nr:hypothetical protein [Bacteroidaceae bacterium]MBR6713767.1 hypothetical protein [Bacteroidaceae bacterium]